MSADERDVLDDAIAALRAETAEPRPAGASASARRNAILLAAGAKRRRSAVVKWVLPMAAVLAAGTAWAAVTGRLLRSEVDSTTPAVEARPPVNVPVPVPVPDLPASVAVAPASASASAPPPPPSGTGTGTGTFTGGGADPEEAAYRTAHTAHFVDRDSTRALAAWDKYLALHPRGRFAPEARYNRALSLLRLGRRDEARAALRPFADGELGGYRQKEATQLLEALE